MKRSFSVIIPVYLSHTTLERCLQSLSAQTLPAHEIIVVDSSPDERSAEIIRRFSFATLLRQTERMLMHEARNVGVEHSTGEVIVFTDPDCVANPDWLERLNEEFERGTEVVGGGIACFPGNIADTAAHLVKFWLWMPSGKRRNLSILATANFAISRKTLAKVGALNPKLYSGDTEISYRLRDLGYSLVFQPSAVVQHIHEVTPKSLIAERYRRGEDFARLRIGRNFGVIKQIFFLISIPLLPFKQFLWRFWESRKAECMTDFISSAHLIFACECAWMLGQAWEYIKFREK